MKLIKKSRKIINFFKHSFPTLINHPLWRRKRLSPLGRFLKLQLFFLLGEKELCLKWFDDLFLYLKKGDTGLTGNYYFGLHEFYDMGFLIHLIKKDDLFLDIGANLGSYSQLASGLCNCKSIAYEPVPTTFQRLSENIKINHLIGKVQLRNVALNNEKREKILFSIDKGPCNSIVDSSYQGKKRLVEVSSLDIECGLMDPVLMKIDVEGFEENILKGSSVILKKDSLLAIIIEGQTKNVNDILSSFGFEDFNYDPFLRKLKYCDKKTRNKIWIKKEKLKLVKERLLASKKRVIYGQIF